LVKKTRLRDYDSPRQAGLIAINLREDEAGEPDELIGAMLANANQDLILVSRSGQSIRFPADDRTLRPMGRATSGVTGMKFRADDEMLSASVVRPQSYLFTVTAGGTAKRTELSLENYRQTGRGGLGVRVANLPEDNGQLVGALVVDEGDEVLVIMEKGKIVRSAVDEVRATGRTTQGVHFAKPGPGDRIIAVAKNVESKVAEHAGADSADGESPTIDSALGGGPDAAIAVDTSALAPTTTAFAAEDNEDNTGPIESRNTGDASSPLASEWPEPSDTVG
jgi:DNA gyrase subunit A